MQLTDEQKQQVTAWIAAGAKLSDVQQRLADEFDIRLTYMEARFLVDDLNVTPAETAKPEPTPVAPPPAPAPAAPLEEEPLLSDEAAPAPAGGNVTVKVDEIMRPGAVVSGTVTFSDGGKAMWHLDQMGRLGLSTATEGYRPPPADVPAFQAALDAELQKMGF